MSVYPTGIDAFTTKVDNVDDVFAADVNGLQDSVVAIQTTVGTGTTNLVQKAGDTMTGDLVVTNLLTASSGVSNIGSASNPFNRLYVDSISAGSGNFFVHTTGDTMSGPLYNNVISNAGAAYIYISGSVTEGILGSAIGANSHAEGSNNIAHENFSHAEGSNNVASGISSHVEGNANVTLSNTAHAEGNGGKADGFASHTEGDTNQALGYASHSEGVQNFSVGTATHSEGTSTQAIGDNSHAEGSQVMASGSASHAEGSGGIAIGFASHVEGTSTTAVGSNAHAEGQTTEAIGSNSHAEGNSSIAAGIGSHAEGNTQALADYSHSEGFFTIASGTYSHAGGYFSTAQGLASHAGGYQNLASGDYSFAEGHQNSVKSPSSVVFGESNLIDTGAPYGIMAGQSNVIGGNSAFSAVFGSNNKSTGNPYTIVAGLNNDVMGVFSATFGQNNKNWGNFCTVAGQGNQVQNSANSSLVCGASNNVTNSFAAFVIGASNNVDNAPDAIIGGGSNTVSAYGSLVAGNTNVVSGSMNLVQGVSNKTYADVGQSIVVGASSEISGTTASFVLGNHSYAGAPSAGALGWGARAMNTGTFVFTDSQNTYYSGTIANALYLRFSGGVWLTPETNLHVVNSSYLYDVVIDHTLKIGPSSAVSGNAAFAMGNGSYAVGDYSFAQGQNAKSWELFSHAEGVNTQASGIASHAEGVATSTFNTGAHAEGAGSKAWGQNGHAEGNGTVASGNNSHAEGSTTTAYGLASHAEGSSSIAWGDFSHAGGESQSFGTASFSHGFTDVVASGLGAFAIGRGAAALHDYSAVMASDGATSTSTKQFTMQFSSGVTLASGTDLHVGTSGTQDIGTANNPIKTLYATAISGVSLGGGFGVLYEELTFTPDGVSLSYNLTTAHTPVAFLNSQMQRLDNSSFISGGTPVMSAVNGISGVTTGSPASVGIALSATPNTILVVDTFQNLPPVACSLLVTYLY